MNETSPISRQSRDHGHGLRAGACITCVQSASVVFTVMLYGMISSTGRTSTTPSAFVTDLYSISVRYSVFGLAYETLKHV